MQCTHSRQSANSILRWRWPSSQECDAWILPLVGHTSAGKLPLHHIDAQTLFQRRSQCQSISIQFVLSYSYFPFPSLSNPCRPPSTAAPLNGCQQPYFGHFGKLNSVVYLCISFKTATVLALTLTRWYVCCQLSWFCLFPRETLERVNQRQRAA